MKKIFIILIVLMMAMSLSNCTVSTYATTQDDMYIETEADIVYSDVDYSLVIRYGTPYYYNGSILYYLYNNIYYYPYYYNNYWYFRSYRRPFPYVNYRPYFRPHKYDHRFNSGFRYPRSWYRYEPNHVTPRNYGRTTPNRNNHIPNRGSYGGNRQSQPRTNNGSINHPTPNRGMNGNRPGRGINSRPSTPSRGGMNRGGRR